jgi:hypothetical protein
MTDPVTTGPGGIVEAVGGPVPLEAMDDAIRRQVDSGERPAEVTD